MVFAIKKVGMMYQSLCLYLTEAYVSGYQLNIYNCFLGRMFTIKPKYFLKFVIHVIIIGQWIQVLVNDSRAGVFAVISEFSVKRMICKTLLSLVLRHWQIGQTQFRRHRMRRPIRVCTVFLKYRKLRVKWKILKTPFRTIFPAYTQKQSIHLCVQCLD